MGAIIEVLLGGPQRYASIRASIPEINDRMLTQRLRELEAEGLVVRRVIAERPVRVEYELTDKGSALEPVVRTIAAWAGEWL